MPWRSVLIAAAIAGGVLALRCSDDPAPLDETEAEWESLPRSGESRAAAVPDAQAVEAGFRSAGSALAFLANYAAAIGIPITEFRSARILSVPPLGGAPIETEIVLGPAGDSADSTSILVALSFEGGGFREFSVDESTILRTPSGISTGACLLVIARMSVAIAVVEVPNRVSDACTARRSGR